MSADLSWLASRPIAHRGYHDQNGSVWENTLSAFASAIERGFAIECDVHLTSDGVPIVFHDTELMRLTGKEGFIWQRTSAEMAALKIGTTQDRPPTLAEALDLVSGKVPIIIELKGVPGHDGGLVAAVAAALSSYSGPAAIMSFDHWLIRDFRSSAPNVPGGLTAEGLRDQDIEAHFSMLAHGISFVSYSVLDIDNRFVSFVRERLGLPVITWTVRDRMAVDRTRAFADQMTFEGFNPDAMAAGQD